MAVTRRTSKSSSLKRLCFCFCHCSNFYIGIETLNLGGVINVFEGVIQEGVIYVLGGVIYVLGGLVCLFGGMIYVFAIFLR